VQEIIDFYNSDIYPYANNANNATRTQALREQDSIQQDTPMQESNN
jgi:hypothetical protein